MTIAQKAEALLGRMLRKVRSSDDKLISSLSEGSYSIQIHSSAFAPNMRIPRKYTQDGDSISPPLSWTGVPDEARELVLVCEDPDAPRPEPVLHWIVYHIPARSAGLPENIPKLPRPQTPPEILQGDNISGKPGWIGPKPPIGHGVHHYHFQLFALDQPLNLSQPPTKDSLLKAMQGHVLAQGELIGTYERAEETTQN